jgi:hypothetical protein
VCTGCGSALEPVAELVEIVGFRLIGARNRAAGRLEQQRATGVGDLLARRAARQSVLAQARIDAERWIDDGGSFRLDAAAALPRPTTDA